MRLETRIICAFKTAMKCLPVLVFGAAFLAKTALADSAAITFTPTLEFNNVEATVLGWSFDVTSPITVTALGYWDYSEFSSSPTDTYCCSPFNTTPGLLDDHEVGIYNISGTLLASADVPAGTAGTLVGDSFYTSIAPIVLT